ncbi:MAG: 4-hydroxy-tetrahydrodipicolinate synthase [Pseudomonadota bacterium]
MITGSMVALVTPMNPNGDIDWPALDQLIEMHIEHGTHGIVAMGTTGESATLNIDEHCTVIQRVINVTAKRIPVIAGTGANSTSEAIELTQKAKDMGADACLLVTPYYNKPTQEGLYQHYKVIAETVDIPQILYNVPGRTGCDLLNETVARLADLSNIVAIKDATGDMTRGQELIALCADRIAVFSGDDESFVKLMQLGAQGNVSVTANVAPGKMADICNAALASDFDTAHAINDTLLPLHANLFCESNPIPVKWALMHLGLIQSGIRLPLTELSQPHHQALKDALTHAGIE